jgi:hypothetical protein
MTAEPMHVPAFSMKQRITMMANKYELIATDPDWSDGPQVTFYTEDALRSR